MAYSKRIPCVLSATGLSAVANPSHRPLRAPMHASIPCPRQHVAYQHFFKHHVVKHRSTNRKNQLKRLKFELLKE